MRWLCQGGKPPSAASSCILNRHKLIKTKCHLQMPKSVNMRWHITKKNITLSLKYCECTFVCNLSLAGSWSTCTVLNRTQKLSQNGSRSKTKVWWCPMIPHYYVPSSHGVYRGVRQNWLRSVSSPHYHVRRRVWLCSETVCMYALRAGFAPRIVLIHANVKQSI